LALAEHFVVKSVLILTISGFMEVVHVKLTDKRCKVIMLEVARENTLDKIREVFDNEGLAIFSPSDYSMVLGILIKKLTIYNILPQEFGKVL
jgi:hypothetical protein